jgi:hypothetical protein
MWRRLDDRRHDGCVQMLIDGNGRRAADGTSLERDSGMRTGGNRRRAAATRAE